MRQSLLLIFALTGAACSPVDDPANRQATASPTTAAPANAMLGDEPASSPNALAARATVERYFKLIDARDYAAAYAMWGGKGADTRGTLEQFKASFAPYSAYVQKVGEPTAIKATDGKQYILVTATVDVRNRKTGKVAHRDGTVMLRRSADPAETDIDKKEWRIWGTDIRVHH